MSSISREKGAIFCPVHPKKKLLFLCKQCNILICNKCILNEHLGHPGDEVEEVAENKFGKLDDFITKTEEITIPQTKQTVKLVEAQVSAREKELEAEIEEAYRHEKHLIELVKNNTHKTVGELKSEIQTINQQLSQYKSESDRYLEDLKRAVNEYKETKKTKNDILLIDVVNGVEKLGVNAPSCQSLPTRKKYRPGLNASVDIANAFGCVRNDGDQIAIGFQYMKDNLKLVRPTASHQDLYFKGAASPIKSRQHLTVPHVHLCTDLQSRYPNSIERFSDGTLCYCCSDEPYVCFLENDGGFQNIKLDVRICDVAIHPTTDVLHCLCFRDKSIRTVDIITGTTSIVFTTVDTPYCMAFTGYRTILVGFSRNSKVVNYTLRGEVLKSVDVQQPLHISVCNITGNIVIAGWDSGAHVITNNFQKMFVYKGPTEEQQRTNKKPFICSDAVFDTEGHILMCDYNNNEFHVVDACTGKHLETIKSEELERIRSLCILGDGKLVMGTDDSPSKLIFVKYMYTYTERL